MQQKLADYQRPAPELSWDEIDNALDARRSRPLWVRRLAAAAVVLLIAGGGYLALHHSEPVAEQPAASTKAIRPMRPISPRPIRPISPMRPIPPITPIPPSPIPPATATVHSPTAPDSVAATAQHDEVPTPTVEHQPSPAASRPKVVYPTDLRRYPAGTASRLTAKVYMSNTMGDSRRAESSFALYTETIIKNRTIYVKPDDPENPGLWDGQDGKDGISGSDGSSEKEGVNLIPLTVYDTISNVRLARTDRHVHHRQPVRFGLSLRYRIDDRWSVESGLSYTRLSSEITTLSNGMTTTEEQRLNYIGVPLNVGYQLWGNRRFGFYVLAGSMIEKMLDASPWQFSVNGAAGAEYMFNRQFSIYAEPGVGYYFPDGSNIPTIYQDHRLNLNLSLGLRLNL